MEDPKSLYREALEIINASTTIPLYRDFEQGASVDDLQSGVQGLLEWISLRTGPDAPALQSARELLEALGQLGEEESDATLQRTEEAFAATFEGLLPLLHQGPTWMKHANLLVNVRELHALGWFEAEVVSGLCATFTESMAFQQRELRKAIQSAPEGRISQELPETEQAYDELLKAAQMLQEGTVGALITAADRLDAISERYLVLSQRENSVFCVKCGHSNLATDNCCTRCNARLLKEFSSVGALFSMSETASTTTELVMTDKLSVLFAAIDGALDSSVSPEQLAEVLEDMYASIQGMLAEVSTLELQPELQAAAEEILAGGNDFLEALERTASFVHDGAANHLTVGRERLYAAAQRIQGAATLQQ